MNLFKTSMMHFISARLEEYNIFGIYFHFLKYIPVSDKHSLSEVILPT
ncbi:hypothetical protein DES37_110205 [Mangrovibacter plantisponsor]|uniref:Uncharacterized protein n=1 Tax=Mangrovibacter plantisponsor TaxID=451513 RepID=A0A317PVS3_9ENTR|nr:hypothetical protein DES37_110205 [Mangrovibacter plantisponsor]